MTRALLERILPVAAISLAALLLPLKGMAETGKQATQPGECGFSLDFDRLLADPAGSAESLEDQLQTYRRFVASIEGPLQEAKTRVALANWLLAVPMARPAMRWLLDMERPEDREKIARAGEEARKHLKKAVALLDSLETDLAKENQKRLRKRLRSAISTLEPFAELFQATDLQTDQKAYQSACMNAALNLAEAREAELGYIAACALLWQSFGWELADRTDRALLSLPEALKKPDQMPYDFLSRLLRCRILMDKGEYPAASALTIRMRHLCRKWFNSSGLQHQLEDGRRLVALFQCRIGKKWLQQLKKDNPAQADHLEKILAHVQEDVFYANTESGIFFLEQAVPIIIEMPEIKETRPKIVPQSAPTPATSPVITTFPDTTRPPAE